ncbi:MAG: PTS sugar transporter subunit IIA [Pararhodobacter sp.]|nr:PTS sugar transporter subunit IIA [Pararhodobacter sp.]
MELAALVNPQAVRLFGTIKSKKRLFQEIADIAAAAWGIDPAQAVDALQERESLGSTGVGQGVALPHARIDGVERVRGVFVRLENTLDYGSVDRAPVDLVFALFAPHEAGVEHLKALALVSRMLRDNSLCAKLRANSETDKLFAILTAHPDIKAA